MIPIESTKSNPSCDYYVGSVYVKNIEEPWIEIAEEEDAATDYVVIEPRGGLYDLNGENEKLMYYGSYTKEVIDSDYIDEIISTPEKPFSVTRIDLKCIKKGSNFKHNRLSTFIAMSDLFYYINDSSYLYKNLDYRPYIIINTKLKPAPNIEKNVDKMVNEITAAFVNVFHNYPIIFIAYAYSDDLPRRDMLSVTKKK